MTATDATFTPIRPGVLATEVRKQIRSRILDGTVRPGEPLKDSVLAASMGVSRSPVREALQMLEQAGLLEKTPNKSYVVKTFTDRDVEEVAMLRIAYETLAVHWLVEHKTPVADLEQHLERMAASDGSTEGDAGVVSADSAFHNEIVALTRLPRLIDSYTGIRDQTQIMLMSGQLMRRDALDTQHARHADLYKGILAAIESGDSTSIVAELDFHIRSGMLLKEFPELTPEVPLPR